MPALTGAVGKSGQNRIHDVALLQAAMSALKGPDRRPLWSGPVDGAFGRHRQALEQAIMQFQRAKGLRPNGRIDRSGLDAGKLEQALPASHRRMAAVPGTAAVFRASGAGPNVGAAARETERKAPLPHTERIALAALLSDVGRLFGLGLTVTATRVSADGRFRVTLRDPNTAWLDGATKRFRSDGKIPETVCRILGQRQGRAWRPAAASAGSAGWSLVSARAFAALKGAPRPDRRDLAALGITHLPTSQPVQACVAGCITLLNSGRAGQGAGRREFEALLSAIQGPAPDTARRLQLAKAGRGLSSNPSPTQLPVNRPAVIKSGFGPRIKPLPGASKFHNGVDFRAPVGAPIYSTEDGIVDGIGSGSKAGNHIFVQNHDGSLSSYSHTSPVSGLHVGQAVRAGDQIGFSDGSGNISGPHLHYVYRPGTPQSPATRSTSPVDPMQTQLKGIPLR